ncbi:hypothetical protein RPB_0055 [Rhodopseudomonas palustris HaA2]|uniref:Uncharacterized protein n=1 Tax=Rhodopseudomonas palustris (strain HaA2) TaxID=316058 RepID=Q2J443_RHOP2|nr:hypothetical protein [Rhodopseudomonas palustris]ABD04767.1 hypothetical protein RPB_0055 [Rhodopseudomonas palustris HaA2]
MSDSRSEYPSLAAGRRAALMLSAALAMIATAGLAGRAQAMGNDPDQKVVRVVSATYGANCGVAPGNATRQIAASCNGRRSCSYAVSYKILGDPAYGCKKDFRVRYFCGRSGPFEGRAPGEAGYGTKVSLICN